MIPAFQYGGFLKEGGIPKSPWVSILSPGLQWSNSWLGWFWGIFILGNFNIEYLPRNHVSILDLFVPHITVWGSCFSLGSRRSPPSAAAAPHSSLLITHSSLTHSLPHSLTHYSLTHSSQLITAPLIFRLGCRLASPPPPPLHLTHSLTQAGAVQRACLLHGRRTTQSLLAELRRAWPPLKPRLPFAWQAQYTEPPGRAAARVAAAGAAAAFGVAGAVHRASCCSARGCCWGRGCLWHGRRSTQSLLDELRRAWPPLGPRLPFAWQAQYTGPPGGVAARVAAAGAAAAFGVAGAVHRASWTSCGARGRRWGHGCLWRGRRSTQSLLDELRRAWPPLGPRLPLAWQAQYTEPPHWHTIFLTQICLTPSFRHHPWHTNFDTPSFTPLCPTPSFTHNFVTHHLAQTTLSHTIFHTPLCHTPSFTFSHTIFHTPLCHTPSFTHHQHHLSHKTLPHTIFHTPLCHTLSFTHHFVTHHLSHPICDTPSLSALCHTPSTPSFTHHLWHTIFHTQLCHTLFFTHHLSHTHTPLSHTIFDTTSLTHTHHLSHTVTDNFSHTIFHTQLCHTPSWHTFFHTQLCHAPSFTTPSLSHTIFHADDFVTHHLSSTSSFVFPSFPVPAKISCSILEEVDLWGYPVLLFFVWKYLSRGWDSCWKIVSRSGWFWEGLRRSSDSIPMRLYESTLFVQINTNHICADCYLEVSQNRGTPSSHPCSIGIFHHRPSNYCRTSSLLRCIVAWTVKTRKDPQTKPAGPGWGWGWWGGASSEMANFAELRSATVQPIRIAI